MRQVIEQYNVTDVASLIKRVQEVGQQLVLAQPKELAVGNIVRRILGVIRLEAEENREANASNADTGSRPRSPSTPVGHNHPPFDERAASSSSSASSPLRHGNLGIMKAPILSTDFLKIDEEGRVASQSHTASQASTIASADRPLLKSMFSLLSHPASNNASPIATPGNRSPTEPSPLPDRSLTGQTTATDLGAEVGEAIEEIIEELETADDQIAGYALDHVHSGEVIMTYGYSVTVQKFLLKAAGKRKFTVVHAESFPNHHDSVHATVSGSLKGDANDTGPDRFHKSLTAAGITVILIPDSAIFALMSRVNKVVLDTHAVLADGGLVADAGTRSLAKAASMHKTPVVVLSGVYKLSPIYPFNTDAFVEYGDAGRVIPYGEGNLMEKLDLENPLHDYVPPELIDLYITNL